MKLWKGFDGDLHGISMRRFRLDISIPRIERLVMEVSTFNVPMVLTEDSEELSSSPPPVTALNRFDAVELCLFFLGNGGRTFPGISVRNWL